MNYHRREKFLFEQGYYITKDGRLYNKVDKEIIGSVDGRGYLRTGIRINGKMSHVDFHRFVAYCKFGDKLYDEGMVVRHLDSNKLNNSWDNISIGTVHDNSMDRPIEQRIRIASNAGKKHSDEKVREIIKCHECGMSYSKIMEKFGISSKGTLSFIIKERIK